jgi:rhodanese-related sulfurtransferase
LLYDEAQKPYCIFTGDTLFVGDVGRPDLFSGNLSKEQLAALLYKTLQEKIKPLADDVILYPAHGPGSACGKNLGKETASTIGTEKKTNYALQDMTEAEFVQIVTDGLDAPPAYFLENARINQQGYPPLADVLQKALFPLSVADFKQKKKEGAWIVDTRPATLFTQSFVPDSISIGLEGRFAEWAGSLLPLSQPLLLVTEEGREAESATRLARVGIDQVQGYLKGGLAAWMAAGEPIDMVIDIEADELAMDIPHDDRLEVIDVRKKTEFAAGHIAGAVSIPLDTLADPHTFDMIDTTANLYLHCAGGYRSVIAASLLKRAGFHNLRNILGGYGKIKTCPDIQLLVPHKA